MVTSIPIRKLLAIPIRSHGKLFKLFFQIFILPIFLIRKDVNCRALEQTDPKDVNCRALERIKVIVICIQRIKVIVICIQRIKVMHPSISHPSSFACQTTDPCRVRYY